jgi:hypothetical protein
MSSEPVPGEVGRTASATETEQAGKRAGFARRVGTRLLREAREAVAPTLFFFVGFNLIVLTTNLLVAQYSVAVSNFMLATIGALVVGKAVLVANNVPVIRRFDRAPLIWPILFKTWAYWIVVILMRLVERFVDFAVIGGNPPGGFPSYLIFAFSWHRFIAISLWILALFLIHVAATEFSQLFGPGEIPRLLFTRRPSELHLTRRQRMRELMSLSRLADEHPFDELRDPASAAHQQLIGIVQRLAR